MAACVLFGTLIITPARAASPEADSASASTGQTTKKQKLHRGRASKKFNQETPTERERRLKRECKGMPNAGACLGYGG
jgi:hypothetical protein